MDTNEDAGLTVEFDSETKTYRANYENANERPGLALVEAVAAIEETDPIELKPLGTVIDVDAFDTAIESTSNDASMQLAVSYEGYDATFHDDGTMQLQPTDSDVGDAAK